MTTLNFIKKHQSIAVRIVPGSWKLAAHSALTLEPREDGVLRIAQGRVWATVDGPHRGPLNDQGDAVIASGSELALRAGQRLVIENWNAGEAPASFSWDRAPRRMPVPPLARHTAQGFGRITQPLADLHLALVFGAGALGRLVIGLAASMRDLAAIIPGWPAPSRCNTKSGATKSWT